MLTYEATRFSDCGFYIEVTSITTEMPMQVETWNAPALRQPLAWSPTQTEQDAAWVCLATRVAKQ